MNNKKWYNTPKVEIVSFEECILTEQIQSTGSDDTDDWATWPINEI